MVKEFLAPAKINLCLHVLGKRPDGYHDVAMLMQRISLYDRVRIALVAEGGVRVNCSGLALAPGEENIAARAARRILELSGVSTGVEIHIDKQIPVAAGLGGGSSDAATVLVGLNEMLGAGLDPVTLVAEGAKLGADVPFFVNGRTAWATGIGECLQSVDGLPPAWYVLINPGVAVSTAWVYQNLRLTSQGVVAKLPKFPRTVGELAGFLANDLERVTIAGFPIVEEVKARVLDLGARGALMSGSGPTVFGVFDSRDAAESALSQLRQMAGWRVFLAHPLED
ncbi:4-diphosphocytidyl-2-C-methyl-D-erythritol kinase [Desulfuromonas versatilis]|uniref:4-diphosphocytidyl-2-C-methyl-D-erythritol kinase n=1 Tax=Desulfuromonas versatilis TaxID=2802975 RepID=A0ABN6E0Y5_9BACT|nr:4-(cytidine 5'-diphospho)-2-C-methyl-D-erythritol kinase [Desulfuromonas versatilis]BCR05924.1 4-diphosphocytidyl-2-C-methyl-D-erythritol kinase [Desulfuromonas versatilis]